MLNDEPFEQQTGNERRVQAHYKIEVTIVLQLLIKPLQLH